MSDETFALAEQAVERVILDIDPNISNWRHVTPAVIGWSKDDWLAVSRDMVIAFNGIADLGTAISISAPARIAFYERDLIDFVAAIADVADQIA